MLIFDSGSLEQGESSRYSGNFNSIPCKEKELKLTTHLYSCKLQSNFYYSWGSLKLNNGKTLNSEQILKISSTC